MSDWRSEAACLGRRDMFPEAAATQAVIAKTVCLDRCPYVYVCRHENLHEKWGVWGGLTENQREQVRKGGRLRPPTPVLFRTRVPA